MKKGLTEMVFILDRSGSMRGLESDTIGGFNSLIEKQRKENGEALVSTVLFSHESTVIHDRVPLESVPPLTEKEYYVTGSTALLDAIGDAIHHIVSVHRYIREEDRPEHTIFVITTDGMENASRRWSSEEVKARIEKEKTKYGWEFLFLGANIDSVETAERIGIDSSRVSDYVADSEGTMWAYRNMDGAMSSLRRSAKLDGNWSVESREYLEKVRGKKGK